MFEAKLTIIQIATEQIKAKKYLFVRLFGFDRTVKTPALTNERINIKSSNSSILTNYGPVYQSNTLPSIELPLIKFANAGSFILFTIFSGFIITGVHIEPR